MALVSEILDRAAELIEPEGRWTQGAFARNATGEDTGLSGFRGEAVCWCALGAIADAAGEDEELWDDASDFLKGSLGGWGDVERWNDTPGRTQPEVVAKLREAAALARARGQ